jgi:hypothetical protein
MFVPVNNPLKLYSYSLETFEPIINKLIKLISEL